MAAIERLKTTREFQEESRAESPDFGALIVSLDFELLWGVRDLYPSDGGSYRDNLLGARLAIPRILALFEEFEIAATWATVGFLFAATSSDLTQHRPEILPDYADSALNPYNDVTGRCEEDDPLRYAASLIKVIRSTPRQEIGSHTYSHYYCIEPGHTHESFRGDLESATSIARERGIELRSLVFPRNQFNPDYAQVMTSLGFTNCRTNESSWMYRESAGNRYRRPDVRAGRLVDTYFNVSGSQVVNWSDVAVVDKISCLPASRFLRPYSPRVRGLENLRLSRITKGIREAATSNGMFHLWWHPHNFGANTEQNLAFLGRILEEYRRCRDAYDLRSLSMYDAASVVKLARSPELV